MQKIIVLSLLAMFLFGSVSHATFLRKRKIGNNYGLIEVPQFDDKNDETNKRKKQRVTKEDILYAVLANKPTVGEVHKYLCYTYLKKMQPNQNIGISNIAEPCNPLVFALDKQNTKAIEFFIEEKWLATLQDSDLEKFIFACIDKKDFDNKDLEIIKSLLKFNKQLINKKCLVNGKSLSLLPYCLLQGNFDQKNLLKVLLDTQYKAGDIFDVLCNLKQHLSDQADAQPHLCINRDNAKERINAAKKISKQLFFHQYNQLNYQDLKFNYL